jgi:SAM-dependent methyltransferase
MDGSDRAPDAGVGAVWDERYRRHAWSTTPDPDLVRLVEGLSPARALDLGCGTGRNACWLALQGWQVTGVDASGVGLDQARAHAEALGVTLELEQADVREWEAPERSVELVVMANLHPLPEDQRTLLARASRWLVPGGHLFVTGHHRDALGGHGPPDPVRLYTEEELEHALPEVLRVEELRRVERLGADADTAARDIVVVLFATR